MDWLRRIRHNLDGWRACAFSTLTVFVLNLTLMIIAVAQPSTIHDGQKTLYTGSCDTTNNVNTGLHVVVNALSTVLLGASSYCMQCLCAPTRDEVDKAHAQKQWLDIGILSVRNLRGIARKRVVLWLILGLSSLPIHLFYNSAIYASTVANIYFAPAVTQGFLVADPQAEFFDLDFKDKNIDYCGNQTQKYGEFHGYGCDYLKPLIPRHENDYGIQDNIPIREALRLRTLNSQGKLERLDRESCIRTYLQEFQATRGNVLLVSVNTSVALVNPFLAEPDAWGRPDEESTLSIWRNSQFNGITNLDPNDWTIYPNMHIDHCLSEHTEANCSVFLSLHMIVIVVVLNFVKVCAIFATIIAVRGNRLMNLGDAIKSFLEEADTFIKGCCLVSKKEIEKLWGTRRHLTEDSQAKMFRYEKRRLVSAASGVRWLWCVGICMVGLILLTVFVIVGCKAAADRWDWLSATARIKQNPLSLKLGEAASVTRILLSSSNSGTGALLSRAVLANAPQLILSYIYFLYNGLFTAMSCELEWESYIQFRKGLRVSGIPEGEQRRTYFLGLPYRISVPLMVLSSLLHWLLSQAIFVVNLEYKYVFANPPLDIYRHMAPMYLCFFSPLGLLLVICFGALAVIALIATASLRFKTPHPVIANCSAAIAAACHVPLKEKGEEVAKLKIQWGVTGYDEDGIGHCSFSKEKVTFPEWEALYK